MIVEKISVYDGTYLRRRFAYDHFLDKTQPIGNIIAFRSPIKVDVKSLIDKDLIIKGMPLCSDDAINLCLEIPNINMFSGVCFQRLFNSGVGNMLASEFLKCDVEIDGANIIIHKECEDRGIIKTRGVASITDVNMVDNAVLIHTGIHISAGEHALTTSYSTKLSDDQCIILMRKSIEFFYGVLHEIFVETSKKVN